MAQAKGLNLCSTLYMYVYRDLGARGYGISDKYKGRKLAIKDREATRYVVAHLNNHSRSFVSVKVALWQILLFAPWREPRLGVFNYQLNVINIFVGSWYFYCLQLRY